MDLITVEGMVARGKASKSGLNLRKDGTWLSLALDQREPGPARLMVAFANRRGDAHTILWATRTEPRGLALRVLLEVVDRPTVAAVAYCDEPVSWGPAEVEALRADLAEMRLICLQVGIHLVDWIACDDDRFRSWRLSIDPGAPTWWDVPSDARPHVPVPPAMRQFQKITHLAFGGGS